MRNEPKCDLTRSESDPGEASQVDYSYNQWQQARMRQLERDYEVQCEKAFGSR